jgi:hypothetical protein
MVKLARPSTPEQLFAEYHALRADPTATRAAYDALSKKTRAAKAAMKKIGDPARMQQMSDLQNYIAQFQPVDAASVLTPEWFAREVQALVASPKTDRHADLEGAVRALWRRLEETRGMLERDPDHDSDHDAFTDHEGALTDLAHALGVDLSTD